MGTYMVRRSVKDIVEMELQLIKNNVIMDLWHPRKQTFEKVRIYLVCNEHLTLSIEEIKEIWHELNDGMPALSYPGGDKTPQKITKHVVITLKLPADMSPSKCPMCFNLEAYVNTPQVTTILQEDKSKWILEQLYSQNLIEFIIRQMCFE